MKDIVYSLGIILTFILGVWNIINNYRSIRRTSFINTVTSERIKWMEHLRNNISTFCGLAYTWSFSKLKDTEREIEIHKEVDKLHHYIRLQLNPDPNAHLDRRIEELIYQIPNLTHETKQIELTAALNDLVEVSQELLKDEWEKVKLESKIGDLKDNEHCLGLILRKLNEWCLKRTKRWAKSA
jgi:hypothetical protein